MNKPLQLKDLLPVSLDVRIQRKGEEQQKCYSGIYSAMILCFYCPQGIGFSFWRLPRAMTLLAMGA